MNDEILDKLLDVGGIPINEADREACKKELRAQLGDLELPDSSLLQFIEFVKLMRC